MDKERIVELLSYSLNDKSLLADFEKFGKKRIKYARVIQLNKLPIIESVERLYEPLDNYEEDIAIKTLVISAISFGFLRTCLSTGLGTNAKSYLTFLNWVESDLEQKRVLTIFDIEELEDEMERLFRVLELDLLKKLKKISIYDFFELVSFQYLKEGDAVFYKVYGDDIITVLEF